jgi:hypothetical protein
MAWPKRELARAKLCAMHIRVGEIRSSIHRSEMLAQQSRHVAMNANVRHPKRLLRASRQCERRAQNLTTRFTLSAIQFDHSSFPWAACCQRAQTVKIACGILRMKECRCAVACGKNVDDTRQRRVRAASHHTQALLNYSASLR